MASSLSYAAKGLFADPGNFIRVHYGTDTPVIRIRELGQLEYGLVNLHLEILNPANEVRPVSVRIIGRIAPDAGKPELNDSTLLDTKVEVSPAGKEIVLFKRLLQDKNIRELAVQVNDAKTGTFLYRADLPVSVAAGYEVTYSPHPGTGVFKVIIDPLYAPIFNKPRNVGVQIRGKGSTKPALEKTIRVQTGRQGIVDFPEQKIPVGDDEIVVIVKEPGIVEEQRTIVPFHRPERPAEWEIDRPGREPGVPPPWIPVTLQGNTLSLWGRTVTFGTSLLPVQMTSQGIPMLTEPIRMISGKENEPMPLQDESCKAVRKDTEGIEVETRAIGPDNLRISSKIRTEFDGVMRVDLTIIPPKHGVTLNRLAVRIPLSGNVATQYVLDNRFAFLPFGRSVFGRTTHLWIGNDDAGLCWFTENFAGWNLPDDGSGGIVINRTERETTLQIWMIDVPTRITTPLTFTFGLLATPCKPLPKDWQMRDFQGYNPGHYKKIGFTEEDYAREQYYQIFSQDVFFDPVLLTWRKPSEREPREDLRKLRENGHNCVAWSQFTTVGRNVPDYCYYGEEWRVFPSGANWQGAGGINLFAVCPKSSWGDCLVKGVEKMAQIGFNGQYFDTGTLSLCRNPFHGCGYLSRDGRMERTIPFFAAREIKKRIYKVLYKEFGAKGQPFYISTLCNGDLQWPMLTFDTAVVSGEEWNGRLADDLDYTKILTLPEWRVKFWPVKWGFIHVPIPSLADLDSWENRTAFETLSIYRLSAGTPIWPCQNPFMYVKLWRVQRAFGVQEGLEFHPCWESPPYITAVNKKTTVAFYRNENELLVTVCNFDEKPVDELLTFTLKKIGLAGMIREAFDLYHEEKIAVRENILSFPMEPKTFRMIRVTMEH